jgi:hypothetical protein
MNYDKKNEKTTYTLLTKMDKSPKIIFDKKAIKWFEALADLHQSEVGCFAFVDDMPDYTFFVRDAFYPKHELMTAGTCEISSEGEALMVNWLLDRGRTDDLTKRRCWCHSHHSMGVFASGQDEDQAIDLAIRAKDNYIRCIFNKAHEMSVSFYDYDKQLRFDNVKWTVTKWSTGELDQKLAMIQNALSSTDKSDVKLDVIEKILHCDPEMEDIKAKIKELMETHVPKREVTTFTQPYSWMPGAAPHSTPPLNQAGFRNNLPSYSRRELDLFNDSGFESYGSDFYSESRFERAVTPELLAGPMINLPAEMQKALDETMMDPEVEKMIAEYAGGNVR